MSVVDMGQPTTSAQNAASSGGKITIRIAFLLFFIHLISNSVTRISVSITHRRSYQYANVKKNKKYVIELKTFP